MGTIFPITDTAPGATAFLVCEDATKPIRLVEWYWLKADAYRRRDQERKGAHPRSCVRVGRRVNGEWVTL